MVDDKKRRFLKHVGIVTGAGVLGLAVAQGSGLQAQGLIDDLETSEQKRGYRFVWASLRDMNANYGRTYEEYYQDAKRFGIWKCRKCGYIYGVAQGREARFDELPATWVCDECGGATKDDFEEIGIEFISGGKPIVNNAACAYHFDSDGDGRYADEDEGVFCTMPCKTICPVDAISKAELSRVATEPGDKAKRGPHVALPLCIGCGRCHKICGYNCIEWVNKPYTAAGLNDGPGHHRKGAGLGGGS